MIRVLSLFEKASKAAEIPKNFMSSLVWRPLSLGSLVYSPASVVNFPCLLSLSFHVLFTQRLSHPSPNSSVKNTLPLADASSPTQKADRIMAGNSGVVRKNDYTGC